MKKETLAQKLARKSFESAAIQQSWQVHLQAFGPLLVDSFVDNYPARIHLCAALNRISQRDGDGGRKKLSELEKHLLTPMDHAAYHFFLGLSHEIDGEFSGALTAYRESCHREPDFFMPYLKLAKFAQEARDYDTAEAAYRKAILLAPVPTIQAAYYTNLCGCLTCMHKFPEAYAALMQSRKLAPTQPGRDGIAAIYFAATGDRENAENCLSWVQEDTPVLYPGTKSAVDKLLRGENPHYTPVKTDPEAMDAFWLWFRQQETLTAQTLSRKLGELFPYLDREPMVCMEGRCIFLSDWYMVALKQGYAELLARCPEDVKAHWQLEIVPYHSPK